jgi:uncharacterized repeat protein (TIGR02543 family)
MKGQRVFLVAFFGTLLCAGLFTGCDDLKDLFHPEGPSERVVTFNLQGGNIDGATTTRKVSVKKGDTVGSAMPSNPNRDGYIFDDWYTAINGGRRFTPSTTVDEDITVYARWTPGTQSPSGITNITYSSVSGGEWTLQDDGSRKSPWIDDFDVTKARISFTGTSGASITILLRVSSESGYDWAFIGGLDNVDASYTNYYSRISGEDSIEVTIMIPSAGSHSIDIGYRKDGGTISGSDCAWFTVIGGEEGITLPSNLSLAESLTWIANNAVEGGAYTITVKNNETIAPTTLWYSASNVSISIVGGAAERTVSLSSNGSLFTVNSGVILTLGNNVSLQGRSSNTASLVRVNIGGTLVMENGSKISGNSNLSSDGGGVFVGNGSTFTQNGGTISGNSANRGGGVFVDSSGTFTKQSGGTIYGSNASDTLKNTATSGDDYGHAVYVSGSPSKLRNSTADSGVTLNSAVSGDAGGWETVLAEGISNITYSSVSGGEWTLQPDGSRKSPSISDNTTTKARIDFTSTAGASIMIQLTVSSEANYDWAFIGGLDNEDATYSNYYSRISGEDSVTVTITIPSAGSHSIDIGYRKDGGTINGSDCAWFMVLEPSHSMQISLHPVPDDPPLSSVPPFFANEAANFSVDSGYTSYAWYWNGESINGAMSSTYTIEANTRTPGVYELSVVVITSAGQTLSARCRVTIKAN